MGFESFRVELRGGHATRAQADEAVRLLPHATPDAGAVPSPGSTYYTVTDRRHVIEVEVSGDPPRVSLRFTLCHPPSVDAAFLALVRDLMARLGMGARVCDDVPPEQAGPFPLVRFAEFADLASQVICARRAEWAANFGPAEFPATTPEVYEKVILPRCIPVGG
ncbi:MAG: hypothetical protein K2X82_14800 [Gemmataceae bacterium]|nr:hypothetical protein [Gemmataceae bacterium]